MVHAIISLARAVTQRTNVLRVTLNRCRGIKKKRFRHRFTLDPTVNLRRSFLFFPPEKQKDDEIRALVLAGLRPRLLD